MLAQTRQFFADRNILEVDTNLLTDHPAIDCHITPISTPHGHLITSPELAMKNLLSQGIGDIYQISHVFRAFEQGTWHHPEFTMIEYYRLDIPFRSFIDETAMLIQLFLGPLPIQTSTYKEIFLAHLNLDPFTAPLPTLQKLAPIAASPRDTYLDYLLSHHIEPHLGLNNLTVITDYPPSQAALAKTENGTAQRFEIYHQGRELCNGYNELTDPDEYKKRNLPHSDKCQSILSKLPPCCGVAIGFDRLLALRNKTTLSPILP